MDIVSNKFEKRWFAIFMALYFLIMLPLPWYYNEAYVAGYLGVPTYIYGWIAHAIAVIVAIMIFAAQCSKRPEYNNLPEYKQDDEE